jgi:diguanylate cyclase (GGDEF)-like protein
MHKILKYAKNSAAQHDEIVMAESAFSKSLKKMTDFTTGDVIRALTGKPSNRMSDRIAMLGIPPKEITQSVSLAVSALLEKIDDQNIEIKRIKEQLEELERLVDVDCVAPIPNRRAFIRRLSWAVSMTERYGHPSSVLYFDLNGFKAINDSFGHAAGDMALKHVSQVLISSMRESDFLARIGGDEFAMILYHANEADALDRGKKIAEKLQKSSFLFNGRPISLTTAFGAYTLQKGDDAESALSAADTKMYIDKRRTRSRATNIEA